MNEGQIVDLIHRAMYLTVALGVPILGVCLAVGLVVSIFEAVTQIHEQAMSFVPKIIAVLVLIAFSGSWMTGQLESFIREVFSMIAKV